jgi:hypothetical protein
MCQKRPHRVLQIAECDSAPAIPIVGWQFYDMATNRQLEPKRQLLRVNGRSFRSPDILRLSSWSGGPVSKNSSGPGRPPSSAFSSTTIVAIPSASLERLEQIRKALPATTDAAVVRSCSAASVVWAGLLKQVLAAIATYDESIDELARASRAL